MVIALAARQNSYAFINHDKVKTKFHKPGSLNPKKGYRKR